MPVAPPRPKGPPLNALRAFEAAARLGGFRAAADELCVTPGAITQHVRALEAYLGAPLFDRHARGVRLTALGADALAGFTQAFDQMGDAVQHMRARAATGDVHIAALPAIAQLWLSPRLPALRAAFPRLKISITALETPPNLKREPFDMALFFAENGMVLTQDALLPVAAPGVTMQALWLSDATWDRDWDHWLAATGQSPRQANGAVHSLYALAVAEACAGAGVLMGHAALLGPYLADGRLVALGERVALDAPLVLTSPHDLTRPGPMTDLACALKENA